MTTTKIKAAELTGAALDLAVSRASNPEGRDGWGWFARDAEGFLFDPLNECRYSPSTDWAKGGPIIEIERIRIDCPWNPGPFEATCKIDGVTAWVVGPTVLIAAMRCYVASKLGDEVDIPKELQ